MITVVKILERIITVAADNSGDFNTIKEAYDSISNNEKTVIYIKNGAYFEKLIFSKPNITLRGEDKEKTIIRYNDCALRRGEDYKPIETFKTATLQITPECENFVMEDITVENCAGYGKIVGQAVALYLDTDKSIIRNCILKAHQDTLLNAPYYLEVDNDPYIKKRQYFYNCYIEGDVDFIFGGAIAIFDNCEIYSKQRPKGYNGYITASCASSERKFGYVFTNCKFTGNADNGTVFFGRPWRPYANVAVLNCEIGPHLNPKHFSPWNPKIDDGKTKTCKNLEYNNFGENYSTEETAPWVKHLSREEAEKYTVENIFEGWVPKKE